MYEPSACAIRDLEKIFANGKPHHYLKELDGRADVVRCESFDGRVQGRQDLTRKRSDGSVVKMKIAL